MIHTKIWVDDVRPAPDGFVVCRSVMAAKQFIEHYENEMIIDVISMDHDAGSYAHMGGDYIKFLDWLEETGRNYPIRIHSQNPVGIANMRRIIQRNGWKEVF